MISDELLRWHWHSYDLLPTETSVDPATWPLSSNLLNAGKNMFGFEHSTIHSWSSFRRLDMDIFIHHMFWASVFMLALTWNSPSVLVSVSAFLCAPSPVLSSLHLATSFSTPSCTMLSIQHIRHLPLIFSFPLFATICLSYHTILPYPAYVPHIRTPESYLPDTTHPPSQITATATQHDTNAM